MTFSINDFLKLAINIGASDIHLRVGEHPAIRLDGRIEKTDLPELTEDDLINAVNTIVPKIIKTKATSAFDIDFPYELKGVSRFRVNLCYLQGNPSLVLRCIPYTIKAPTELNLPKAIEQFTDLNNGLVLVTGPTGSGKSTTLASLIDFINQKYSKHIITIEDPIEFIFTNKKSIVSQRQVGIDTPSFADGIKYSLRQDPDVILIGEVRDVETVNATLKAAETGHLVFATLHTNDAIQTINRIINFYEPDQRDFIRKQLANILRGTIAQKLVLSCDQKVRYPATEVLVVTPAIKDFIEKENLDEIYDLVRKGSFNSMITMNMSLHELVIGNKISEEEAISKSDKKTELQQMLKGVYYGAQK